MIRKIIDDVLRDRLNGLQTQREHAVIALDRAKAQAAPFVEIDPTLLHEFGRLMRENLTSGAIPFRKAYLQAIISMIEVDDHQIRIRGHKDRLERAILAGPGKIAGCSQMST